MPITPNERETIAAKDSISGEAFYVEGTASTGAINVNMAGSATTIDTHELTGMVPIIYDAVTHTATSGTVDTYKYYTGGTGGTLQATLTVTYTDSTHQTLVSSVRT